MLSYFFDPQTSSYPEFSQSVPIIVLSMFFGAVLAALISLYHKKVLGAFVGFLIKSGADSEEKAIKLDTTSFSKNIFVKGAIRRGIAYKRVLHSVAPAGLQPGKSLREKREYVLQSSYYIPEDLTFRAENLFLKRGTTVLSAVIGLVLCLIIALISLYVIPGLSRMFNNLFSK